MRSHIYNNPADDPEAEPFLKAIADAPGDQLHRQIFADWLEENGYENAAKGQRWAAKHGKQPINPYDSENAELRNNPYLSGFYMTYGGETPTQAKHRIPPVFHRANNSVPNSVFLARPALARAVDIHQEGARTGPELMLDHEKAFLSSAHKVNFHSETGEPLNENGQ